MSSESNDVIVDFMNHCLSLFKDAQERDIGSDLTVFLMGNIHSQLWRGYRMRINKTFENTYYPSEIKNTLVNDAINFIQSEARYRNLGIPYKRGYLLYGPPGTGKSSAWYALARKLGRNVYKLSLESSNIGVIRIAVSAIPPNSIMVIDDIDAIPFDDGVDKMSTVTTEDDADAILSTTAISSATPLSRRPVSGSINISTLLDILDGYDYLHGCFVIFTSNYPERLDKRLLRSGRVDLTLHIDLPTPSVIRDMFMYVYGECPEIPDDTKITVTTADIMSRVITLNQDYDHAVHALNELLTDKNITTEDSLSDESDAD
jgi:chaperone BCS1